MKQRWGLIVLVAVISFVTGGWLLQRGVASGGNFAFTQASFMDVKSAARLLDMGDLVTFWVFKIKPGTSFVDFKT